MVREPQRNQTFHLLKYKQCIKRIPYFTYVTYQEKVRPVPHHEIPFFPCVPARYVFLTMSMPIPI
jgi:hypothetical protein